MSKNKTCLDCGKKFHGCGVCCDYSWEFKYCSKECVMKSTEYKRCEIILRKLTNEDIKLIDEHGELFVLAVIEWIMEHE